MTKEEKLELIEGLFKLMTKHQVDRVKIEDIEIDKKIHLPKDISSSSEVEEIDEETAYYSNEEE